MRLPKLLLASLLLFYFAIPVSAQVGIGTPTPNNSAMLDIQSINKGVLFPRMTTNQRMAVSGVNGLIVYDTDSSTLYIYTSNPVGWKQLKALASLKDLVAGTNVGDILVWDGNAWVIKKLSELFTFYYRDKDGDGLGDQYLAINAVTMPPGYVANNGDCDDNNASSTGSTFYRDNDGDGYGNPSQTTVACTIPSGYVANDDDCNDNNPAVNPGVPEHPSNGIDDNCDGTTDFQSATDFPDDSFIDANADGIDGMESAAIFVSGTGNDANPGTKSQPKRTITAGIAAAVAAAKTHVYVANGTYNERVTVLNGISIYGGYSSVNWSRALTNEAIISGSTSSGRISGIEGNSISSPTTIDMLKILTPNAIAVGVSNYGVYLNNCPAVVVKNCNIEAGSGGNGVAGSNGLNGAAGSNGSGGAAGNCDGAAGAGGPGGASACGRTGGNGGSGGAEGSNNGQTGGQGVGGTPGGTGGAGCTAPFLGTCTGSPGTNGSTGNAGSNGAAGSGGLGGTVTGGFWTGGAGGTGGTGSHGNGGGGGGGGGGQGGGAVDDGGGNGGGGGGGGGCAGTGSLGGTAGGGSFGIFVVNSTGIVIQNNTIRSSPGGTGGAGGAVAGVGGNGGAGALGASSCTGEIGRGGNGGAGGKGGDGGYGGGGAGGPSYGIYRSGTSVTMTGNTITNGAGGAGGSSSGNNGSAGASGTIN